MKRFFRKIVAFLASLFNNLNEWIYDHVQPSIELVNRLKKAVESPYANLITTLIPGQWDNLAQEAFIKLLTKAIDSLRVTEDIVFDNDWTSKIAKLTQHLRSQSKPMRAGIYHQLAVEFAKQSALAKQLAEAEKNGIPEDQVKLDVKGHSLGLLVQMQYSKMKEKIEANDLPDTDAFLEEKNALRSKYAELYQEQAPVEMTTDELKQKIAEKEQVA
jgi:hypothetical protein